MKLPLLALACVFARYCTASNCKEGFDYYGGELPCAFPVPLVAASNGDDVCSAMCSADPQCTHYVYAAAGCNQAGQAPVCWLKQNPQPLSSHACRCAGTQVPLADRDGYSNATVYSAISPLGMVQASFGANGLVSVSFSKGISVLSALVLGDSFTLVIDGFAVNSTILNAPQTTQLNASAVLYRYAWSVEGPTTYFINVTYVVEDGFAGASFLSKTMSIMKMGPDGSPAPSMVIYSALPWANMVMRLTSGAAVTSVLYPSALGTGGQGAFLRYSDGTGAMVTAANGFLSSGVQPFDSSQATSAAVSVGYHPVLTWNQTLVAQAGVAGCDAPQGCLWRGRPLTSADASPQAYVADTAFLSLYQLSGLAVPPPAIPAPPGSGGEGQSQTASKSNSYLPRLVTFPSSSATALTSSWNASWLNYAERDALRYLLEHHYLFPPVNATVKLHTAWTESDYQIDIANGSSLAGGQYGRIISQAAALGLTHILAAPANTALANRSQDSDGWGWENILWLGAGVGIRKGTWTPGADPVPDSIRRFVALTNASNVSLVPYIYPTLGFTAGPPSWLLPSYTVNGQQQYGISLDNRAVQTYLTVTISGFMAATGSRGMSTDYMTWEYAVNSSVYSMWAGWRRVHRDLRLSTGAGGSTGAGRGFVLDNRCCSQWWGPWMWLTGSYTSPLQHDEQPESWSGYVADLHTDRLSANLQRAMSYPYMTYQFAPPSAVPGFTNHNSDRKTPSGDTPWTDFNVRDFDFYGTPYSVVSSIATGGLNSVVNMLPARDDGEYAAFPLSGPGGNASALMTSASVAFYRSWLDWADSHIPWLRRAQALPYPPGTGVVDGTYMAHNGSAFVFLFNPNSQALPVPSSNASSPPLTVDAFIGLDCNSSSAYYDVAEVWPLQRLTSVLACGDALTWQMEGKSAVVLQVTPSAASATAAAASAEWAAPVVLGRAARTGVSAARIVDSEKSVVAGDVSAGLKRSLRVRGLEDAYSSEGVLFSSSLSWLDCAAAPAFVLIPATVSGAAESVLDEACIESLTSDGCRPAAFSIVSVVGELLPRQSTADSGASCLPGPLSLPRTLPGWQLVAVWPQQQQEEAGSAVERSAGEGASAQAAVFIHNQPVEGMGYNASFAGGALRGTVLVPTAVFAQLAQRNTSYPVPWKEDDAAVPWLLPGRLLLFIDSPPGSLGPGQAGDGGNITAAINGSAIPVLEAYNCRTTRLSSCFAGYWIDLSAAGVQPDTPYELTIELPPILPAGTFNGVYYDNVDTIYAAL